MMLERIELFEKRQKERDEMLMKSLRESQETQKNAGRRSQEKVVAILEMIFLVKFIDELVKIWGETLKQKSDNKRKTPIMEGKLSE